MLPWPDPDTAVQLSVEDLGLRLLHRVARKEPPVGRSNLIGLGRQRYYEQYTRPRPKVNHRVWEQKVSEAFDWLIANGLLVRDASQTSDNWVKVSQLGHEMLAAPDSRRFFEAHKLLAVALHPRTERRVRQQFVAGEIESAVFVAVREVEIAVREVSGLGKEVVGVKLMAAAFKPGEGPLHDPEVPTGEQAGVMALYTGLIGALKNPSSPGRLISTIRPRPLKSSSSPTSYCGWSTGSPQVAIDESTQRLELAQEARRHAQR